jgi:signal transduction histidine kinase
MNSFISGILSGKFRVFSACDGRDGLEQALRLHPDLILCDIVMPGMSGDQLVREIRGRAELDDVPIVLLSVVTDTKLKVDLLKEGAQDYLPKPFRPDELLAKVERIVVDRSRAAEEIRDMRQLSVHMIDVRDRERKQVANELHENVAQYLAALGMYLYSARNLGTAPSVDVQRFLDEGRTLLARYSGEIQTMARVLYPAGLDELGLAAAIRWKIRSVNERHGIEVTLEIPPDLPRLPTDHELVLYRVMEEALANVLSHSGSKMATVRVFCDALEVGLEVIDSGSGIQLAEGTVSGDSAKGTGIHEMRERLRNLGGRLEIASTSDGTRVRAVMSFVPRQSEIPH